MKAFISYSTKDKKFGGRVKSIFDDLGIESFLAHDDLRVSEEWKTRILSELKSSKIFVPLISKAFKKSDWCSQETGVIANKRGVLIIPLSLDNTNPYGFISHIQGHRIHKETIDRNIIYEAIGEKWPSVIIDSLLPQMKNAHSYRQAEATIEPLVPHFRKFTKEQANIFAEYAINNGQIWYANLCQNDYLPKFLKVSEDKIKQTLYKALKYQVDNGSWYNK